MSNVNINGELNFASLSAKAKEKIIDLVYPINTIVWGLTSPASEWGGTWLQIKDKFLLSAGSTYIAGSTGGEATHTLTSNEMPSHNHQIWSCSNWSGNVLGATHSDKVAGVGFVENRGYNETWYNTRSGGQQIIQNTGGGQAHNNMPPYEVKYAWQRTA